MAFFQQMRPIPGQKNSMAHLIRNTTKMAMAPGITLDERLAVLADAGRLPDEEEKRHSYYKIHLKDAALRSGVKSFLNKTAYLPSKVWILDGCSRLGEMTANGPFKSQAELEDFIISTERKEKTTRIVIIDGLADWSAAVVGTECRVPLQFFLETIDEDEQYVQLRSAESSDSRTFSMDNARIQKRSNAENTLHFDALGDSAIEFVRSHIHFSSIPHRSLEMAVLVCHEKAGTVGTGASLVAKLIQDSIKGQRLCADINWLVSDVFYELNSWTDILEYANMQLLLEREDAKHPQIDLTTTLHEDMAIHIRLQEMLRVQIAVLDSFCEGLETKYDSEAALGNSSLSGTSLGSELSVLKRIGDIESRLKRHQDVLSIITRQTSNLVAQVYNSISISESLAIGKITWITLIFLPLSFVASLFSMNIEVLSAAAPTWSFVVIALAFLFVTVAFALAMVARYQHRSISRRQKNVDSMGENIVKIDEESIPDGSKLTRWDSMPRMVRFEPDDKLSSQKGDEKRNQIIRELRRPFAFHRPLPDRRNAMTSVIENPRLSPVMKSTTLAGLDLSNERLEGHRLSTGKQTGNTDYLQRLDKAGPRSTKEAEKFITDLYTFVSHRYGIQDFASYTLSEYHDNSADVPIIVISPPQDHEPIPLTTGNREIPDLSLPFQNHGDVEWDAKTKREKAAEELRAASIERLRQERIALDTDFSRQKFEEQEDNQLEEEYIARRKALMKALEAVHLSTVEAKRIATKQAVIRDFRKANGLDEIPANTVSNESHAVHITATDAEGSEGSDKSDAKYSISDEEPVRKAHQENSADRAGASTGIEASMGVTVDTQKLVKLSINSQSYKERTWIVPYQEVCTWDALERSVATLLGQPLPRLPSSAPEPIEAWLDDAELHPMFWESSLRNAVSCTSNIPCFVIKKTANKPAPTATSESGVAVTSLVPPDPKLKQENAVDTALHPITAPQVVNLSKRSSFPELYLYKTRTPNPPAENCLHPTLPLRRDERKTSTILRAPSLVNALASSSTAPPKQSNLLEVDFENDRALARSYSSNERMITVGGQKRKRALGIPTPSRWLSPSKIS